MDVDLAFVRSGLITYILLVASLTVHEWAHAFVADRLGDDTPRAHGRLSLNPMAHIDMFGTVLIPLINIFVFRGSFALIGWGRPVMINPSNFLHRRRDEIMVSLAGPFANLVLALLTVILGAFFVVRDPRLGEVVRGLVVMNVGLAVFNLLPLPPLDGGTLLRYAVGMTEETYYAIARWSGLVMLFAINIEAFRTVIAMLFMLACLPYAYLCDAINPAAMQAIFPFFSA
jgi:Zn-dependent protease